MFSIVNRSPRRCNAFPPTATTNRCFFPFAGPEDDVDDDEAVDGVDVDDVVVLSAAADADTNIRQVVVVGRLVVDVAN